MMLPDDYLQAVGAAVREVAACLCWTVSPLAGGSAGGVQANLVDVLISARKKAGAPGPAARSLA